ncbi:MAG: peptide-methionine (S)-S-oxide reductase MsrA [Candidatus Tectomicrobia bacterium]|uniref:Peptide methionine sulfoxide reductase MsrA n=1 Tax=Tectimicrobiota bacterium TaxID=2528274 RepID=A0A937W482_UNCTE|nr:peptide-methionine (S)-S-oxide reductase MsrA [Candidatus Tectomicrobia bacterium]
MSETLETTTLGGGCFWCVEAVYQELRGVYSVVSGYAGGIVDTPTYRQVCDGNTGHAEVAQITFDPMVITFDDILYVFWRTHDPTTLNRQGYDVGTQYRSVIMYHSEEQRIIAERSKRETDAAKLWSNPIVTEIVPCSVFYRAEDYHQNYYRDNPYQRYCMAIIDPKIRKLRKEFHSKLKDLG